MAINMIGKKFGKLTAVKIIGKNERGPLIECMCDCGNDFTVAAKELRSGNNKSCGCLVLTHGMAGTRPYRIWQNIKKRCNNPKNPDYKRYGGRGIKYEQKWETFNGFWEDMQNGYEDSLTIDRIDVNQGYSKGNCRWVDKKKQANNTRSNHTIEYNGDILKLSEMAEKYNADYELFRHRIMNGWDVERALFEKIELETITLDGVTKTVVDFAEEKGMTYHQLKKRLMRGWTVERALTQPLRKRQTFKKEAE
jgi:hypothetical protein